MVIQLHARKRGETEWKIRAAYSDENKQVMMRESLEARLQPVPHGYTTRDKLREVAVEAMHTWANSGNDYDTELRVTDTETMPKEERRAFEKGRT